MNRLLPLLALGVLTALWPGRLTAQDLATVGKTPAFRLSGSLDINVGFYEAFGNLRPRRDRFSYLLAGNVNPYLLGIDVPMSATYSQQETTFLQPFNQFGLSPHYKGLTVHAGYRNLTYSNFTLNGHTFLGAGADYVWKRQTGLFNYRIGAMYGRLRRPVEPLEAERFGFLPAYRRMGYSVRAGVISRKRSTDYLDFVVFKADDKIGSIEAPLRDQQVKPEENLVLGLRGQVMLFKQLSLTVDAATSALTRDVRAETDPDAAPGLFGSLGGLYTPRVSSEYREAFTTRLQYTHRKFRVGTRYQWIAPDYRTLGSYFFQNDLEELTVDAGTRVLAGKGQISASVGLQRNNLNDQQSTSQGRFIGAFNWTHTVNSRFNYNVSLTNFSSSLLVQQDLLSDSLNLYQISTNLSTGANYTFGTDNRPQRLGLLLSHQIGNSRDEYFIRESITKFYNAGLNYQLTLTDWDGGVQAGLNATVNDTDLGTSTNLGPSAGVFKRFLERKVQARYVLSYLSNLQAGENLFGVITNRLSVSYQFLPKHRVRFGVSTLNKADYRDPDRSFSELRTTAGYRINF